MVRERKAALVPARMRGRIVRTLRWAGVAGLVLLAVAGSYVLVLGATIWSVSHQIYHPLPGGPGYAYGRRRRERLAGRQRAGACTANADFRPRRSRLPPSLLIPTTGRHRAMQQ